MKKNTNLEINDVDPIQTDNSNSRYLFKNKNSISFDLSENSTDDDEN